MYYNGLLITVYVHKPCVTNDNRAKYQVYLTIPSVNKYILSKNGRPVELFVFMSLSTLYRSYHGGEFYGQRKPVYTVGQGSVNC